MNLAELNSRLDREGYDHLKRFSGPHFLMIDDFAVDRVGGFWRRRAWRVCDLERGEITHTYMTTPDEDEACQFWYDHFSGRMLFLASFPDQESADTLQAALEAGGVRVHRNDIYPDQDPGNTGFRVFVAGRDLAKAKEVMREMGLD